jgi:hypothetical protein
LFGNNEPGFTFEPWDITTLYQDRAGTTPVTAAGQSVGLRLSKDQGLRIGAEKVTNGTFDADLSGWTVTNVVWSAGSASFTGAPSLSQNMSTTSGVTYRVTINVSGLVGGSLWLRFIGGTASNTPTFSNGTTTFLLKSNGNTALLIEQASGAITAGSVDNISVRELAGNHQVAVSDAKRGVYGWMPKTGRRNLLTYTEQFDNAVWTKGSATISSTSVTSPVGDAGADRLSITAAQNNLYARYTTVSGSTYTLSVYAKGNGQTLRMVTTDNAGAVLGSKTQALTDSWQRVSLTYSGSGTAEFINIHDSRSGGSASGDIDLWGAQLETGSSATAYQRVASQYDVTEAGVQTCYYVQADGVDDAYVTPTITPGTDKAQVFAGVRKLSDAAAALFIEYSANVNSNNGTFVVGPGNFTTATGPNYHASSKGTVISPLNTPASYTSPITNVVSALMDISGDSNAIRVNGTQAAQSTADQGTGNYLAYPAYIYGRGGTSLPFNGLDFGHAVRFGPNLDAATIARVEALIARNTPGVTL